jgi:UDP-N-acetylmuramoylalanine--D-glutamate ligase
VGAAGLLVVEVSSFQLETVDRLRPYVATWLNLTPDHLERHGDFVTYGALKQRLFARQEEADWAVYNADDPEVMKRRAGRGAPLAFSLGADVAEGAAVRDGRIVLAWRGGTEPLLAARELRLPGAHNLANALAALATVLPLEVSPDTLREVLRGYAGLEHRLEPVATVDGVRFVNDSKATNVQSLAVALESFAEPVVLIAGGRDKGQDFTPLAPLVARQARHLVLIGEGAAHIAAAWTGVPQRRAGSLAEAVDVAFDIARRAGAGTVLLSPACASFDMFQDYEDRGRRFKAEVERLRLAGART